VTAASESVRTAERVAVIADVHGNVPALRAVLDEIRRAAPDLVVSLGDVTWGAQPEETRVLLESLELPSIFVSGNGERALRELRDGRQASARECWMRDHHSPDTYAFLDTFVDSAVVTVAGLGAVRFCHGSPRSDIELVTPETPAARMRALTHGISEKVLLTGHTHLQFDREVAGMRSINPGSVGMPYHELPGVFWAMLGPDVDLRRTEYELEDTIRAYERSGDPSTKEIIEVLRTPPTPAEVIAYAERLEFRE
jgi:putative phosphoesterase